MISATGNERRRGFTLVELLVSVAILAATSVLIAQALIRGAYMITTAVNRLQAYEFASAKMADLELVLSRDGVPETEGQFRVGRDRFSWRVARNPSEDEPALELITLTVSWRQGPHDYETHLSHLRRVPKPASAG